MPIAEPMRLFPRPAPELKKSMDALMASVKRIRPLDSRRERSLPGDVRDLWASLTRDRETRRSAYLSDPGSLSAYLRYFLPWNVYRYLRLLPSLDFSFLKASPEPSMTDYGSGPLALPIALWLAFPELRSIPLTLRALDRVPMALDLGRDILTDLSLALDGKLPAWKIVLVREGADAPVHGSSTLVSAAYFINELDQGKPSSLRERAAHAARILCASLEAKGRILVLDSGDARAASLLAALRAELLSQGCRMEAPCPHAEPCPMPGIFIQDKAPGRGDSELIRGSDGKPMILARGKRPWCHFAFEPLQVPQELERISAKAGLPKARASLSFLYAERGAEAAASGTAQPAAGTSRPASGTPQAVRVVSESMPGPERGTMHYICAKEGYGLLRHIPFTRPCAPGDLILDAALQRIGSGAPRRDSKTGAIIFELPATQAEGHGEPAKSRPHPQPRQERKNPAPDRSRRPAKKAAHTSYFPQKPASGKPPIPKKARKSR